MVKFSKRQEKRQKLLKKLTKYNKKLEKLFESVAVSGPQSAPKTKRSNQQIRRLASKIHSCLDRTCFRKCQNVKHSIGLQLQAYRTKFGRDEADFDVLISIGGGALQETRITATTTEYDSQSSERAEDLTDACRSSPDVKVHFVDNDVQHKTRSPDAAVDSLCSLLARYNDDHARLHLELDDDRLWQLPPLMKQFGNSHEGFYTSLGQLLHDSVSMSRKQRRVLSVILAHSLVQLYGSPWLGSNWSKENIYFFSRTDHPEVLDLTQPYLSDDSALLEPNREEKQGIHQYPSILSLGILLLELELGKPLESQHNEEDLTNGSKNANTDLTTAMRMLNRYKDDVYEDYRAAVQGCLDCSFIPVHAQDSTSIADYIYDNIVERLENELRFAFQLDIRDLNNEHSAALAIQKSKSWKKEVEVSHRLSINRKTTTTTHVKMGAKKVTKVVAKANETYDEVKQNVIHVLQDFSLYDDEMVSSTDTYTRIPFVTRA